MFARQRDTGVTGEVRGLLKDPATGLAGRDPQARWRGRRNHTLKAELNDWSLALGIARHSNPANGGE